MALLLCCMRHDTYHRHVFGLLSTCLNVLHLLCRTRADVLDLEVKAGLGQEASPRIKAHLGGPSDRNQQHEKNSGFVTLVVVAIWCGLFSSLWNAQNVLLPSLLEFILC